MKPTAISAISHIEWSCCRPRSADGFAQVFSYNAIRVPLYMAWAGIGEREHHAPFASAWSSQAGPQMAAIDTQTGRRGQPMPESGYAAVASLTLCVVNGTPLPRDFRNARAQENYYPATLHLMALVAAEMRYPSCLRG